MGGRQSWLRWNEGSLEKEDEKHAGQPTQEELRMGPQDVGVERHMQGEESGSLCLVSGFIVGGLVGNNLMNPLFL